MSRGLNNCNPGNIRQSKVVYQGEVQPSRDPAFKQFSSMEWGYRAIFMLLHTYAVKYGLHTIREMISRWAPPSENHTETYISTIAKRAGLADVSTVDTLNEQQMRRIVSAMSFVENGEPADEEEVRRGWNLFINSK